MKPLKINDVPDPIWRQAYYPANVVFAEHQPQYERLPAITNGREVRTLWKLSWKERFYCIFRGELRLTLLTFGNPLQPIRMSVLPEDD